MAVARAARDCGLRATVGPPIIDGFDAERGKRAWASAADALDAIAEVSPLVSPSLAPHGIYTVGEESLRWVAESASRHLPVQLHFLETEDEVTGCVRRSGLRPGAFLDRVGLLASAWYWRTACGWTNPSSS